MSDQHTDTPTPTVATFRQWAERDLKRWGKFDEHTVIDRVSADAGNGETELRCRIYTDVHCYSISVRNPRVTHHVGCDTVDQGYLGCIASTRKPRAGEEHTRGNDLADGPLSEETWRRILADIVSYEMVGVHRPRMPAGGVAVEADTE
jgi:hypothetical protein